MPEVSIVLPTYNGERFLRQAIESIIKQKYTDWELIIVNDCSTDSTPDIAKEYASMDSRIRIINNDVNKKLPESLNIGFRSARGKYLTWTSDDNLYLPDAIYEMHSYLEENHESMMVCTKINYIDESGKETGLSISYDPHTIYAHDSVGACFMYRRQVINDVGEYDTDMFCAEDYDYWLRILKCYGHIDFIDKPLYLYRDQPGSLTATKIDKVRIQRAKMQKKYFPFLVKSIKNNGDSILPLAVTMLSDASDDFTEIKNLILPYCEDINPINSIPENGPLIIYGAGNIGKAAYRKYGNRVSFFADGNTTKCGSYIDDKMIISFEEMKARISDYTIVIAVSCEKLSSIMSKFAENNINSYSVFTG